MRFICHIANKLRLTRPPHTHTHTHIYFGQCTSTSPRSLPGLARLRRRRLNLRRLHPRRTFPARQHCRSRPRLCSVSPICVLSAGCTHKHQAVSALLIRRHVPRKKQPFCFAAAGDERRSPMQAAESRLGKEDNKRNRTPPFFLCMAGSRSPRASIYFLHRKWR